MKEDIMVSVLCTAYNHENFIRDAIEGVLEQKTNFRYELIIHDDASGDHTPKIITEYAERYKGIIRLVMQEKNQYQSCNIYPAFLFPKVRGKYIAFCEGDDYWTDEQKLQKQVDFLENHEDYVMCMHNAVKVNYETGEEVVLNTFPADGTYSQEKQILAGLGTDFPAFASYMVRAEFLKGIPEFFLASKVLDYPIRQYYANCGKVYYFKAPMSVYRVSTPQSYMKKVSENEFFYNNYAIEMIRFFENLNQYTGKKFNTVLECKIDSDYFGFCLSIPEQEGIDKAVQNGLDIGKVMKCYKCLFPGYLDSTIQEVCEKSSHIFIYGASRLAPVCKKQLEHAGISFEGFVVSEGQMKAGSIEGMKIYYLNEVIAKYGNPGFILAIQPINLGIVEKTLRRHGMKNYCQPYRI